MDNRSSQRGLGSTKTRPKGVIRSLEPRKHKNERAFRRSLASPNVGQLQMSAYSFQEDREARPNLSQQRRTKRLYQSLVDTAANIRVFQDGQFRDPRSNRIIKNLGSLPTSAEKCKTATQTD